MRVLMFGWEFPPYLSGGLGTACLGITKSLIDSGVEVLFVMPGLKDPSNDQKFRFISPDLIDDGAESQPAGEPGSDGGLIAYAVAAALHPYRRPGNHGRLKVAGTSILAGLAADGVSAFVPYGLDLFAEVDRYTRAAESIARSEVFDVIHSHDWMTVRAACRARDASGRPWIFHVHSLEQDRSGDDINPGIVEIEQYGMMAADHLIAVSEYMKKRIVAYYGIAPARISVIHNGVFREDEEPDQAVPGRKKDRKNILFLGRITFQKGPDYFIEAAAEVLKHVPNVTFVMAGSGDMMPAMIEKVAELGLGKRFHFTGFLRGNDVAKAFRMSDLYVMPSVSEPFGISPLEATRYGVPVIMSRQSGVAEVLHHCLLVDFWNVHDMADKMIAVLKREPLARELKIRGQDALSGAEWKEVARKIRSVYLNVLN